MRTYRRFILLLLVGLVIIANFSPSLTAQAQSLAKTPIAGLTPIIPGSTHVLSSITTRYALKSLGNDVSTQSAYSFSQTTPELSNIKSGDIIVSDASDMYPNGFLRKVDTVDYSNGKVTLQTSPAAIDEAIQQGEVNYTQSLNLNKAQASGSSRLNL